MPNKAEVAYSLDLDDVVTGRERYTRIGANLLSRRKFFLPPKFDVYSLEDLPSKDHR